MGGRYTKIPDNTNKITDFCISLSNKIQLEVDMYNYKLTQKEYEEKAIDDFIFYYMDENNRRRQKYEESTSYKDSLLSMYKTEDGVNEYFDRLYDYDLVELKNIKSLLKSYICEDNTNSIIGNNITEKLTVNYSLVDTKFTALSHATMGSIYKKFIFNINDNLCNILIGKDDIFSYFTIGELEFMENPVFCFDDRQIAMIISHERCAILKITQEEFERFKLLEIPYQI